MSKNSKTKRAQKNIETSSESKTIALEASKKALLNVRKRDDSEDSDSDQSSKSSQDSSCDDSDKESDTTKNRESSSNGYNLQRLHKKLKRRRKGLTFAKKLELEHQIHEREEYIKREKEGSEDSEDEKPKMQQIDNNKQKEEIFASFMNIGDETDQTKSNS